MKRTLDKGSEKEKIVLILY